ncbi:hypothetical protein A0H76_6 [Hepatospora eriocheir]|uniref:Uncharacterized protein n=1 Tax=Hepatospora eriocheir TaxID=1081669 RepID=A0A1X0QLK9_9MICR|nr:hypothetical protein A0H76_6 [Hepatospora eriocheir]
MDRINKFLNKRPKKNVKVLRFRDKKYKITKNDLKKVRSFMCSKNIAHIPVNSYSKADIDNDFIVNKPDRIKNVYNNDTGRFLSKNKTIEFKSRIDKNLIVDIFPNEGINELYEYKQEWIYQIKESYKGEVEDLKLTNADEILKFGKKYVTPKEKSISVFEITEQKSLCQNYELTHVYNWILIENDKNLFKIKENNEVCYIDIKYNHKNIINHNLNSKFNIKSIIGNYESLKDRKVILFDLSENFDAFLLENNLIEVFNRESKELIKKYKVKKDLIRNIKLKENETDYILIVSTSNGIIKFDSKLNNEYNYLGYVISLDIQDENIFTVNNLNRLVSLNINSNKSISVMSSEIGLMIKVYKDLTRYLIAVMYSSEVVLYVQNFNSSEIMPCYTIAGNFTYITWDEKVPLLYVSDNYKTYLYT